MDPVTDSNSPQGIAPVRCTKDDKNQISLCMCPECTTERTYISETEGHMVNDDLLVGWGRISQVLWFTCPVCNKPSVAVTPLTGELGNYCLNESCRVRVKIESDKLTEFIKSKTQRRGK